MFEDDADEVEWVLATYRRLEEAAAADFEGMSQQDMMRLWVDAEAVRSYAERRRVEAVRELERRRAS
ncbi:hypothetical protein ACIB24_09270 [Spongisporangium articulatum]|uniref:Uncharacterized protein n=1 Tax=Spongisporangium articulatum TaxID=3362603 RepID=A0ABW8ALK1_9ACTN